MKVPVVRDIVALMIVLLFSTLLNITVQSAHGQEIDSLQPSEKYTIEELTQMLAPIALYPDALLSQILMASTYPIEVIEADRWLRMNSELAATALDNALLDKDWDPSVKSICHFPSTLALMSERITETTNLGNAFLAQEAEVLDIIQQLRDQAYSQGNLYSTTEQKVIVEKETIIIQPARPEIIYIPYYDPYYVYGPWWYPSYRPYYWGPTGARLGIGISFWPGVYFGFSFGSWSYFNWHHHHIHIDSHKRPRYIRDRWYNSSGRWRHAPRHRRGVAYRDKYTARKYGQTRHRTTDLRRESRGYRDDRQRVQQQNRIDDRRRRADQTPITIDRRRQQQSREPIQQQTRFDQKRRRVEQPANTRLRQEQQQNRINQNRRRTEQLPTTIYRRGQQETVRQQTRRDDAQQQRRERIQQQQQRIRVERKKVDRKEFKQKLQRERSQQQLRSDQNRRKANQAIGTSSRQRQQQPRIRTDSSRMQRKEFKQQQRGDSVFNRLGDGRVERRSSKRGQSSRQENKKRQGR